MVKEKSFSSRSDRDRKDKDKRRSRSRSRDRERDDRKSDRRNDDDKRQKESKEEKVKAEIKIDDDDLIPAKPKKKEPLSLEELLAKKKAEEAQKSKPVFISKEQRALEAIKRRQEQVAAMRSARAAVPNFGDVPVTELLRKEKDQQRTFDRERDRRDMNNRRDRERGGQDRGNQDRGGQDRGNQDRAGQDRQDRAGQDRAGQDRQDRAGQDRGNQGGRDRDMDRPGPSRENEKYSDEQVLVKDKEKESEAIRERYLGIIKKKRRVRRLNDRKFVFDWDVNEDTSNDYNQLYKDRHYVQFYGRGNLAGIDIKEQKRKQSKFYGDLLEKRRTEAEKEQEKVRLKKVKKKEEKQKWDDRHWTDKEHTDMTERDWRIFREDYNITIKGGKIPNPIRNWTEASFCKDILNIIEEVGYKEPTPIQRQAIPIGLQNRDIIGIAETGNKNLIKKLTFNTCIFIFHFQRFW